MVVSANVVCPSCGEFKQTDLKYGWCEDCILEHITGIRACNNCGKLIEVTTSRNTICGKCKYENLLDRLADRIEQLQATGYSFTKALRIAQDETKPKCRACGQPIRGGKQRDLFCSTNERCIEVKRLYNAQRHRQARRGYFDREQAIMAALQESR